MRIHGLVLAAFLPMTVLASALCPGSAVASCVNPGGTGSCFSSIQAAVTAASVGEVITVAAGTYTERVVIDRSLSLLGAQAGADPTPFGARTNPAMESIINSSGLPRLNPNVGIQINTGVTDVVIDGFTLIGRPDIVAADESVMRVGGPASPTSNANIVIDNNIIDGYVGVLFKGGPLAGPTTENLTVRSNRFRINKNGVVVQFGADDIEVSANTFALLGGAPISDPAAVQATGVGQGQILDNIAAGFTGGRGFGGSNVHGLQIRGNSYTLGRDGINIFGGSTAITIANNDLSGNSRFGVNIKGADLLIELNDIYYNGDSGIALDRHVIDTENVVVSCNDIVGNALFGVLVNTTNVTQIVNGENNWWGDASGPTHAANPGGTGDVASDGIDFDPWAPSPASAGTNPTCGGTVCASCEPCELLQLLAPLLPRAASLPQSNNPCAGAAPPPTPPTEACCAQVEIVALALPGSPALASTHPCYAVAAPATLSTVAQPRLEPAPLRRLR